MNNLRKIFRRVRTLLWTALTLVTVLAAVLVGIGKLLMPYSDYYQPELEEWLSRAFNQPVTVESFDGEWKAFGPRISLRGVTFHCFFIHPADINCFCFGRARQCYIREKV